MDMQEFVQGCKNCDPRTEPERADELLRAAAELGEAILKQREKTKTTIPYQQIADSYNAVCGEVLPKVTKLTDKRKRAVRTCMTQGFTADDLYKAFNQAASTPFLTGKNERGWRRILILLSSPTIYKKSLRGLTGHPYHRQPLASILITLTCWWRTP